MGGVPEVAIAISIATAAASAYTSYSAAQAQNRAMRNSQAAARRIYNMKSSALRARRSSAIKGVLDKRDITVLQQTAAANKARGQIKVAMAGAGLSTGSGSGLALLRDVDAQQEINNFVLRENTRSALEGIQSGFRADSINAIASYEQQFNAAQAQMSNSALQGFSAAIGGFGTGLSIASGLQNMSSGNTSDTRRTD